MKRWPLLFEEIAYSACGISGGLGRERLLDLLLQTIHEFRLHVGEGQPGELLECAGGVRELAFGDEVFGLVNQPLGLGAVRGFCRFNFCRLVGFGGFSGLGSRIGGGLPLRLWGVHPMLACDESQPLHPAAFAEVVAIDGERHRQRK